MLTRKGLVLQGDAERGLATRQCFVLLKSSNGNMEPGVVFEAGLIGGCRMNEFEKFGQMEEGVDKK